MGKFNLWIYWEAYKMRHPESRQILEWQEEYYQRSCVSLQDVKEEGENKDEEV